MVCILPGSFSLTDMAESVRTLSEEEKEKLARDVNLVSESVRTLSEKEKEKLARDVNLVSEFKSNKFEKEAQKNWDVFYKRNTTKFFKDRHWTRREFGELINSSDEVSII